ncbi:hypothetical protein OO006_08770 [Prosthecochloris sp. SCSIO W1101]|uniref:hypothetical protein n=1 Tax=Prosthecochloris sp. SCSIO W1101 TaxID=2992242 RepID=UPI00223D00D3|nr:hypothetical protein [Prosthecochloris sp. SCSIO W1101]UZJ40453.1 hypothetical protein OO006_08770 [Prosthecochloris sp. SCSIO W1101]
MAQTSNQDKEKHYFEMFRKHYQLPAGTIIYRDRPDVIINAERKIGIEITNFYLEPGHRKESEQVQNRWRERVVSEAQRQYQRANERMFELSFDFDKSCPISNKKNLVNRLIELATQIQNHKTGVIGKDLFKEIPELSFVYLNNQEYEDTKWRVVQSHRASMLSMNRLVEIIKDKEQHPQNYEKCDAYWLLVIVDFMNRAQDQEIHVDDFKRVETEAFEKIIVYKTLTNDVLAVK